MFCSSEANKEVSRENEIPAKAILTLEPVMNEVSDGPYKRALRLNGQPVHFETNECYEGYGLRYASQAYGHDAIIICVDDWMREALDALEKHVVQLLPEGEVYKPLFDGGQICMPLSRYCRYLTYETVNGPRKPLAPSSHLASGYYIFDIHFTHVYFGKHRNGETCSISMQVSTVSYKADSTAQRMPLTALLPQPRERPPKQQQQETAQVQPTKTDPPKLTMPKKGRRVKKGLDEVDHPQGLETEDGA